jgi:hypothetical protein
VSAGQADERLFKYDCVDCERPMYVGDDSDDAPTYCPFCGSTASLWFNTESPPLVIRRVLGERREAR